MDFSDEVFDSNDPVFIHILRNCLTKQITNRKNLIAKYGDEQTYLKTEIKKQMIQRKEIKRKNENEDKKMRMLTLNKKQQYQIFMDIKNQVELMKVGLDENNRLQCLQLEEFRNMSEEFKNTWNIYHESYKISPLSILMEQVKVDYMKVCIAKQVIEYKLERAIKMQTQRNSIGWMQTRIKIIELAKTMLEKVKNENLLKQINAEILQNTNELQSVENKLQDIKRIEEENEKQRELIIFKKPFTTIDISRFREISQISVQVISNNYRRLCSASSEELSPLNSGGFDEILLNRNKTVEPAVNINNKIFDVNIPQRVTSPMEIEESINNDISQTLTSNKKSIDEVIPPNNENEDSSSSVFENPENVEDLITITKTNNTNENRQIIEHSNNSNTIHNTKSTMYDEITWSPLPRIKSIKKVSFKIPSTFQQQHHQDRTMSNIYSSHNYQDGSSSSMISSTENDEGLSIVKGQTNISEEGSFERYNSSPTFNPTSELNVTNNINSPIEITSNNDNDRKQGTQHNIFLPKSKGTLKLF